MSRDVIFEEDKSWEWTDDKEAVKWINIDLILEGEEVPTVLVEEPIVPTAEPQSPVIIPAAEPQSPVHRFPVFNRRNTPGASSSSTPPSASSSEEPRRMRNLEELYDATQVMEDTNLFCFFADNDPLSFNKAITEEKIKAMDEEIHAIEKNDTWKLTHLPENKKAIGVKWVYKTKKNAKEKVQKYKAIEEGNIYQNEVHAWHDIPRLSLKGRFVELNSINLEGQGRQPPASQPPAVTDQPPATSRSRQQPAAFTLEG
jgi:hypothetical protein